MKIADLFAEIGFRFDSIKLKEAAKLISDINLSSVIGATSLGLLGNQIKNIAEAANRSTQSVLNFAEATGIDPIAVQQFKTYAQEFGATAEEAEQALYNLNKLRLDVLQGKGNPQSFILTGLVPTTDTLKLLDEIHGKFSDTKFLQQWAGSFAKNAKSLNEMKAAWKDAIAQQFGFSTSLLRTLSSSNEEWAKMKNIITLTIPEMQKIAEANKEWVLATSQFNIELQKSVGIVLPAFSEALKAINESGAFQTFANNIVQIINAIEIITTRWKAFTMTGDRLIAQAVNSVILRPGEINRLNRDHPQGGNKASVTIHVHGGSPQEIVSYIDKFLKKTFGNSDIQFGQQT